MQFLKVFFDFPKNIRIALTIIEFTIKKEATNFPPSSLVVIHFTSSSEYFRVAFIPFQKQPFKTF